jgi:8-oxo-dGTP pyrophosphatase MutT (NUDIX family)
METTRRSALILYAEEGGITIFAGINQGDLTTIGGRRETRESEMDCLIREIKEETRDIIDYTNCPEILASALSRKHNGCFYVFVKTTVERMIAIREQFLKTVSERRESNELSSLELIDLKELIRNYIQNKGPPSRPEFRNMILDIGYDTLCPPERKINHFTDKMNIRAVIHVPIANIPHIVSLFMFNEGLPNIYGITQTNNFFISDQYFFTDKHGRWFRCGFVPHS